MQWADNKHNRGGSKGSQGAAAPCEKSAPCGP